MSTRGPRLNPPIRRPGSLASVPRIVNGAWPMEIWSPTLTPSAVSSSGRTIAPWFCSSACEYGVPSVSTTVPYSGKFGCSARSSTIFATGFD